MISRAFFSKIFTVSVLIIALAIIASCGKKGPPRLPVYEPPPPPSALTAIHRDGVVVLTWVYPDASRGIIEAFSVLRTTAGKAVEVALTPDTGYTDKVTAYGVSLSYKVFAMGRDGMASGGTDEVIVVPHEAPLAPSGLTVRVIPMGALIEWAHAEPGVLFNVYRSGVAGAEPLLKPLNPEPIDAMSFKDNPLMKAPVFYSVRALRGGAARDEGPATFEARLEPSDFVPAAPSTVRAVFAGGKVLLAWKESPELWVMSYRIYRDSGDGRFVLVGESRTPSFVEARPPGGRPAYRVTALGPRAEGPPSAPVSPTR